MNEKVIVSESLKHKLSRHWYMQFAEPPGTADSSIDAAWDYLNCRWQPKTVEILKKLAPPMIRWGGESLEVWNRSYDFHGRVLVQNIVNGKEPLFSRPPAFTVKLAGNAPAVNLAALPVVKSDSYPDVVTYYGEKTVGQDRIKLRGALEFDGCFRGDLEIEPLHKDAVLTVESQTMTMMRGKWSRFFLAGATPVEIRRETGRAAGAARLFVIPVYGISGAVP